LSILDLRTRIYLTELSALLSSEIIDSVSSIVMFAPIWDQNCNNLSARHFNPTGRRNPFVPSGISGEKFEIKKMLYYS
jgi:hypothetical protein